MATQRVIITIQDNIDEVEAVAMVLVTMEQGKVGGDNEFYALRTNFKNGCSVRNDRERKATKFVVHKTRHIK
jgi:hypothetical protein